MGRSFMVLALLTVFCLACSPIAVSPAPAPEATRTPPPATATPTPPGFDCQATFTARELKKPYNGNGPRYTLSAAEWDRYLALPGIQSLCLPLELGAPFVNADWDSAKMPAKGRMVSIGFENLYHGSGWSDIFLVYSTYDFSAGTEFDRFSAREDRGTLGSFTVRDAEEYLGERGFVRFKPSLWGYEGQPTVIYKTWVFPFENDYLAIVYRLGAFEGDVNAVISRFRRGEYPAGTEDYLKMSAFLANSLKFKGGR